MGGDGTARGSISSHSRAQEIVVPQGMMGSADSSRTQHALAPAPSCRLAARARTRAHATEYAAVLHLAEMDTDIGRGRLAGQLELVGLQPADLVADACRLLKFEIGRGIAH